MARSLLFLLALTIGVALVARLEPGVDGPLIPLSVGGPGPGEDTPELLMDGAVIFQFDPSGRLRYRIQAEAIEYFPDTTETLLHEPDLMIVQATGAPWTIRARRGLLVGAGVLEEGIAEPLSAERVELSEDVVIRRARGVGRFVDLATEALSVHPAAEYAETDRTVMITTDSGSTTATGMRVELDQGRMTLGSETATGVGTAGRVHTTLMPDHLN